MPRPLPKRLLDLVVAGMLLVVFLPVLVVVLVAFALDVLLSPRDRGSLLYREARISRGRTFGLLKFRTLRSDVLERSAGHARLLEADAANLTWIGRRLLKPLDRNRSGHEGLGAAVCRPRPCVRRTLPPARQLGAGALRRANSRADDRRDRARRGLELLGPSCR